MSKGSSSLVILRFATIYGEGDRGNVSKLIDALDRGRFVWPGSGENQKSLIYKQDAARACIRALEHQSAGIDIFNVSAPPTTMKEIVEAACQALGRRVPRIGIPLPLLKTAGAICRTIGDPGYLDQKLRKFIHDDVYSSDKFEAAFAFSVAVSLAEGMRREVECLKGRTAQLGKS
jgi:nucleoside-diphosphate-sugar epimerase